MNFGVRLLQSSLFLITFCQAIYAQKNFEPGYVIDAHQDTLKGEIAYLNWSKNPEKINFIKDSDNSVKILGFSEISSFYVHGENYVKAYVDIDDTPYKTGELSNSPIPKSHADTVFLRVLASGPKSLYFLKDLNGREHFYIHAGAKFQWLTNFRYEQHHGDKSGVVVIDTYKQQLSEYLGDCAALEGKTKLLDYSEKSISGLFQKYYEKCASDHRNVVYKTDGIKTEFGMIAGVSVTSLKMTGPTAALLAVSTFPASTQPAGGIFVNLVLPRMQKRVSIYNELFYSSYKTERHTEKYVSEQDHSYNDLSFSFSYLKMNNMARYTVPLKSVSLFFNVGISNGFALSVDNSNRTVTYFYSNQGGVTERKIVNEVRKYEQGLLFGIGGKVKKVSLEARCELGNGMSPYNNLKAAVTRYYMLISYLLK